jgi:hypothetical protein
MHPLYSKTLKIFNIFNEKFFLDKLKNSDLINNLDNALAVFVFGYWNFNENQENLNNLKICLLFREYLNFIGWEHLRLLANYNIVEEENFLRVTEEYTSKKLADNLPELLDDFIGVFLKEDSPGMDPYFSEVKQFISEFCNMLYHEKVINYMVEPVD